MEERDDLANQLLVYTGADFFQQPGSALGQFCGVTTRSMTIQFHLF